MREGARTVDPGFAAATLPVMRAVNYRPLTTEDYQDLPNDGRQYQIVEGELFVAPAPTPFHQSILGNLYVILRDHLRHHPGGKVFLALFDVYLDKNNVVQPDLSWFSPEREEYISGRGAEGPPDLLIEILSPSTEALDLGLKKEVYARFGVREMWIVDPRMRVVSVFDLTRSTATPEGTFGAEASFGSQVLAGLAVSCPEVFAS